MESTAARDADAEAAPPTELPADSDPCPCGSGGTLATCCRPLIARERDPRTAQELMRSRYSAFVLQEIDYILFTHHPDTVGEVKRAELTDWSTNSTWLGLEILGGKDGGSDDETGTVEFHARYELDGQTHDHLERAQFRRLDGVWKFHDAGPLTHEPIRREEPKVGRNEPCPCGSGAKYKRCCGAAA